MLSARSSRDGGSGRDALPDVDSFRALELDRSLPLAAVARQDYIENLRSGSRQFLLPWVRPLSCATIVLIQAWKTLFPRAFTSSRLLHRSIVFGLRSWVRPDANRLVLRHFHLGSDILAFIAANAPVDVTTSPLRPTCLDDLRDDVFVRHDVNLFRFVIALGEALEAGGEELRPRPLHEIDFTPIWEEPPVLAPMPEGGTNRVDLETAIECYTPAYQALLGDADFWRASNSLQLDETIALYVCTILGDFRHLALVANRHPLVPESTLRAGHRLMLHGLGTEALHAMLVARKQEQLGTSPTRSSNPPFGELAGSQSPPGIPGWM